jgi:membrane-associated protein
MLATELLSWLPDDQQVIAMMAQNWMVGVLMVAGIVFLETGLVIFPFLPGDSLLFATGAFLGISGVSPAAAILLIGLAAVLGDGTNYLIGRSAIGQQLVRRGWVKPHHIDETRRYFDRFGGATITIGRFIPIVRTAAPFLAGLTGMCPRRFALYNVAGAVVWCASLLLAGFWLGGLSWVREHMSWLSMGIVVVSLLPMLFQWRRGLIAAGR